MEKKIQYTGIGEVWFVQNIRARNLSIRINQQGRVRVTVPRYMGIKRAESFLFSKRLWIIKKLEEIRQNSEPVSSMKEGDMLSVRGKEVALRLKHGSEPVEDAIWRILLAEAKATLPGRVEALSLQHGFRATGVKVRQMKTRWGSCTAKNSINLNSWLVMLPEHLCDYVILHELVHTRHKDHSPRFWEHLDRITGGQAKTLRNELRGYQIMSIHTEQYLGSQGDGIKSTG